MASFLSSRPALRSLARFRSFSASLALAVAAAGFLAPFLPLACHAQEKLQSGDLVAICGDSITEGKVYSLYMADYLVMCQPATNLQAFQAGWSGERAPGFLGRMKTNVLDFSPTVATTCYGMNDGGYSASTAENTATYKQAMQAIVKKFKEGGVRFIVVGAPGAVDTKSFKRDKTTAEVYNQTLATLGAAAREVAAEEGVTFADVHGIMADVMARAKEKKGPGYLVGGSDGVHPGHNGHLIMAYAFLKALGCDGNIGTITIDMKAATGEATGEGHKVLASSGDRTTIESTRYPFCFPPPKDGQPVDQQSSSTILEFLPFHQDLNRYMLVVKNPPAGLRGLKVTWGEKSKNFSVEDLAKGVNLAAEFPDNPFCQQWSVVHRALQQQQQMETLGIKDLTNSLKNFARLMPGDAEAIGALERLVAKVPARLKELREKSSAQVIPIKHSIVLEPGH